MKTYFTNGRLNAKYSCKKDALTPLAPFPLRYSRYFNIFSTKANSRGIIPYFATGMACRNWCMTRGHNPGEVAMGKPSEFEKCPRCSNKLSGTPVYQCKRCRQFFCEGCRLNSEECPYCGADHFALFNSNWQIMGFIQ